MPGEPAPVEAIMVSESELRTFWRLVTSELLLPILAGLVNVVEFEALELEELFVVVAPPSDDIEAFRMAIFASKSDVAVVVGAGVGVGVATVVVVVVVVVVGVAVEVEEDEELLLLLTTPPPPVPVLVVALHTVVLGVMMTVTDDVADRLKRDTSPHWFAVMLLAAASFDRVYLSAEVMEKREFSCKTTVRVVAATVADSITEDVPSASSMIPPTSNLPPVIGVTSL